MLYETTVISATTTTLDYLDIDSDLLSTIGTTISTSLTISPPINIQHYYYYGSSYVSSLTDEELANLDELINKKTIKEDKPKQLTLR